MKTKLLIIMLTALLVSACGPAATPAPIGVIPTAQSGNLKVSITNFAFDPAILSITIGSTVTWTNNDTVSHNVIGDNGSWGSNSLAKGDTYSFKFTQAGTFTYHCGVHPSMKATIKVVSP